MSELDLVLEKLAAGAPIEESSWDDVVSRARRTTRTRLTIVAVCGALLALAVPTLGLGGRLADLFGGDPVSPTQLSPRALHVLGAMASGVSPRVSASTKESLARAGAANLRRIAVREGRSYYVANREGGGLCVTITFPGERDPFVGYACSPDFPSANMPLLDESRFRGSPEAPVVRLLEGFAADAITTVELVTAAGTHVDVPVQDNVYVRTKDLPDERLRAILARDASGSVVYRLCLVRGGCR